jgi:drug/metabolite transporter (DMT)-like permease
VFDPLRSLLTPRVRSSVGAGWSANLTLFTLALSLTSAPQASLFQNSSPVFMAAMKLMCLTLTLSLTLTLTMAAMKLMCLTLKPSQSLP